MQLPPAAGTRRQRLSNSEAVQQLISATQSLELGHTSSQEASLAHAKQLLSRKQQIARATISATGPDGKACTFHPTGISDHDAATQELADSIECLAEGKMVGPYPAYADEQQAIVKACIADGNGDVYGSADNGGFARQPFGLWSGVLTFPVRDDDTVTNDPDSSLFDAPAPSPPESLPAERHTLHMSLRRFLDYTGTLPQTVAGFAAQVAGVDPPATPGMNVHSPFLKRCEQRNHSKQTLLQKTPLKDARAPRINRRIPRRRAQRPSPPATARATPMPREISPARQDAEARAAP